jgi:hypothetical protein
VVGGDASPAEANALLHRLVGALIEVMAGRRPLHALYGTMTAPVYESMRTWMRSMVDPAAQYRLGRLHTSSPDTGVVEMCATVTLHAADRDLMVLAGRFERRGPTWRLTVLRPIV